MFANILQLLDALSKNFLETLKRFPIVSFFSFLLTLILVIFSSVNSPLIEAYPNFNVANKVVFTATLAIPLFIVLRLISNNRILTLFGMMLMVMYYILLPESFENNHQLIQKHILFILALILLIFPAPFLFRSVKNAKFWEWTQQVIFAFISALLFGFILYLGVEGAIYAFAKLFYFEPTYPFSKQLLLIVFGIFSLNYFLAQIPRYPLIIPLRPYSKVENIFTKYILTSLSIAYFLILYLYTFKLIYLFEFPSGLLAWLILIFSAIAIITFLFWTPLWDKKTDKYKKWIWIAILLQTLLLGLSIYLRIEQYGITQNRYFIAVSGAWLSLISLYFILYKNALYKWLFISLSVLILLTQIGPFSAYTVAQESQTKQLRKLLEKNPSLSEESNLSVRYQISSSIDYLYSQHGIDSLMPLLPEAVVAFKLQDENEECSTPKISYFSQYATKHLGFKYIDQWEWEQEHSTKTKQVRSIRIYNDEEVTLDIKNYEWFQYFYYTNYGSEKFCPTTNEKKPQTLYQVTTKEQQIIVKKSSKTLATINIESFFKKLKKEIKEKNLNQHSIEFYRGSELTQKKLTYLYENKEIKVKLFLKNIYFTNKGKLVDYRGILVIHEK